MINSIPSAIYTVFENKSTASIKRISLWLIPFSTILMLRIRLMNIRYYLTNFYVYSFDNYCLFHKC